MGFLLEQNKSLIKQSKARLTRNLTEIARSEIAGFFILFYFTLFLSPVDNSLDKPCGFAIIQVRKGNEITE